MTTAIPSTPATAATPVPAPIKFKDVRCTLNGCNKLVGGMSVGTSEARFYCRHCRCELFVKRPEDGIVVMRIDQRGRKSKGGLTNGPKRHIMPTKREIII